jgi:hypothetical protein
MSAANAGLEHSSTPNRHTVFTAYSFYLLRLGVSAYPTELEIDYPSCAKLDCVERISA